MFWHLLSLFAAATPTCATPSQRLKRCLKAICIFESRRRRRWFLNQSARVSCLSSTYSRRAQVLLHRACLVNCFTVDVHLGWCESAGQHESRLIYLNVFEFEATSLFLSLSLSLSVVFAVSAHFTAKRGRQLCRPFVPLLTWIYGISLAELKPLLASQDVNNFPVTPLHINQIQPHLLPRSCSRLSFAIKFTFSVSTATQQTVKTQI